MNKLLFDLNQTRKVLRHRLPDYMLWTFIWTLPIMFMVLLGTTIVQIRLEKLGLTAESVLVGVFVPFVIAFWLQVPFIRLTLDWQEESRTPFLEVVAETFRCLVPVTFAGSVLFVGVLSGLILLLVPGIWFLTTYFLFVQQMMARRQSAWGALQSVGFIGKGHRWRILFALVLMGLLELLVQILMAFLESALTNASSYSLLAQTVVHGILFPLQTVLLTVIFLNIRSGTCYNRAYQY